MRTETAQSTSPSPRGQRDAAADERHASLPIEVEFHPPVQSEFHIPDARTPAAAEGTIQLASPTDRSQLPLASRQPLSSLPSARGHEEPVQSVGSDRSTARRSATPEPIQDAVPPYSAIAEPSPPEAEPQRPGPRGILPSVLPFAEMVLRRTEPTPAPTPAAAANENVVRSDAERPQPAEASPPRNPDAVIRRIEPAEIASLPDVEPPAMESVLAPTEEPEATEFRVPDVDAGRPDEQIVAAFQPPAPSDNDEPVLPARVNDPMEFRITPEDPELQRCPACDDEFVEDSIATWVDPCGCSSPVRRTPEMLGDVFLAAQCEEIEVGWRSAQRLVPSPRNGPKDSGQQQSSPSPSCLLRIQLVQRRD